MSESMITRCPKCSTTFRVTQEVLNMAKGKVRCGQCFHIFAAEPDTLTPATAKNTTKPAVKEAPVEQTKTANKPQTKPQTATQNTTQKATATTVDEDGSVNPDWLNTLFDEEDLEPYTPASAKPERRKQPESKTTKKQAQPTPSQTKASTQQKSEELAPWEMELAQIEDQFSASAENKEPIFSEQLTAKAKITTAPATAKSQTTQTGEPVSTEEPDYMQALHSLAQDISKQDTLSASEYASQESVKQLAAEYSLASLTGASNQTAKPKSKFKWLWSVGTFVALIILALQVGIGYFEQGSRSPEFRAFYKVACTYLSCTLPTFEDISAIEVEHVRIQSHPTLPNTLQVNAIMSNTSRYAQPMPKLSLEFYDLNGTPVAARLFAPKDYLHRDFLDITYMPPNTPIHIVIPIQDPGARAVTHQIKVFASNTRSY